MEACFFLLHFVCLLSDNSCGFNEENNEKNVLQKYSNLISDTHGGIKGHYRHLSALAREYIQADASVVDQTAWCILALLNGGYAEDPRLLKALNWLIDQQLEDGDWPVQPMSGLFYKTTMVSYRNYKRYFSLLALKKYRQELNPIE